MPRPRGLPKTGGRAKGTPNKRTQSVTEKLAALGCDPIEGLAKIAMDRKNRIELRAAMYKELAQYIVPKRKAIEIEDEEPGRFQVEDARERLYELIDRHVAAASHGKADGEQSQNDPA